MRRMLPTVAAVVVATSAWLVSLATPAAAHSVSGVSATNYRTTITSVRPSVRGVQVKVIEAGSRLEVSNATSSELVVFGYQDEPYLRISARGVFENRRSPAVYLNATRNGKTTVPGTADPSAPPQWHKVSDGHTARWHDHRIHWMGGQDPPVVRRDPGHRHVVIPAFTVPMRYADRRDIAALGNVTWVPGPSAAPWWLLAAGLVAVTLALTLGVRRWGVVVVVLLLALVAVDAVHAVGTARAAAGSLPTQLGKLVGGSFPSFIAWGVAIAGFRLLLREDDDGLWFAGFAAVFMALVGGVSDVADLNRSVVPFAWSAALARALVAVTIGLGAGLTASAVLLLLRHRDTVGGGEVVDEVAASTGDA